MADWKNIAKGVAKEVAKANLDSMARTAKKQSKHSGWNDEQCDYFSGASDDFNAMRDYLDRNDDRDRY